MIEVRRLEVNCRHCDYITSLDKRLRRMCANVFCCSSTKHTQQDARFSQQFSSLLSRLIYRL